jgi:hypothetical protein
MREWFAPTELRSEEHFSKGGHWPLDSRRATWKVRDAGQPDKSPRTVQSITVDQNVKLEILDWGGVGRPLVLLSGLGNTATFGYSADRLGDEVLTVLDSLKLNRPVLGGHFIAG